MDVHRSEEVSQVTSTGAQDRDSRRAAHTQRRTALREQREQRNRPARESAYAATDPFALVTSGQPAEHALPF